jgi:hypothetical protein
MDLRFEGDRLPGIGSNESKPILQLLREDFRLFLSIHVHTGEWVADKEK